MSRHCSGDRICFTLLHLNSHARWTAGGQENQSLWSWTPAAQLSLLRSAAKVPLPASVHSLHPAAASGRPGAMSATASTDGALQLAAGATAQPQASATATDAAAAPRAGPLVVFADGGTALLSVIGDELRLAPVAAAAGDAAAHGQVCMTSPGRRSD